MELTVGYLKKVLKNLPDNVVIAHLGECSNRSFEPFTGVKRLLVVKDETESKEWGGRTFLVINVMGTHFTKEGEQKYLTPTGVHFDRDTFKKQ